MAIILVALVGGDGDDRARQLGGAHGLEKVGRGERVSDESQHRLAVRDVHEGLGREIKDDLRF